MPTPRAPHPPLPATASADHLLIPWAASLSETCQQILSPTPESARHLPAFPELPHLRALLERLGTRQHLEGDEYQPAPPHERVLAALAGLPPGPAFPWAALWAHQDGLQPQADEGWGLMTPTHWLMGRDHLTLLHPDDLALDDTESRALFDAVRPLFESEGWHLAWGAPSRWYARHDSLATLPTASLDRVVGRNPDLWMPDHPQARLLKRLQSEVQMLLYQHPVNDEREARGALSVNSFWLSGTGAALAQWPQWPVRMLDAPRQALLRDDLPGWLAAWQALDAGPLREAAGALDAGRPLRLTLCGERHALTLSAPEGPGGLAGAWRRLSGLWRPARVPPAAVLAQL